VYLLYSGGQFVTLDHRHATHRHREADAFFPLPQLHFMNSPTTSAHVAPPSAHVVLYQPEIPQNTGNIGRTCVAVGAKLWIVRPAAFRIDDARLRRAGLDYWQHLALGDAVNWDHLRQQLAERRFFFFSRFASQTIWDAEFRPQDVLVFGRETSGLPESILDRHAPNALRIPMSPHVRSLNLATSVGIALYEHQRQTRSQDEPNRPASERP
jgi:tRNA (cytidine/uridine-2'-O-)-methyltransferase